MCVWVRHHQKFGSFSLGWSHFPQYCRGLTTTKNWKRLVPLKKQMPRKRKQNSNKLYDIRRRGKNINSVAISVDVVDFGSQLKMNHNDFHQTRTDTHIVHHTKWLKSTIFFIVLRYYYYYYYLLCYYNLWAFLLKFYDNRTNARARTHAHKQTNKSE